MHTILSNASMESLRIDALQSLSSLVARFGVFAGLISHSIAPLSGSRFFTTLLLSGSPAFAVLHSAV